MATINLNPNLLLGKQISLNKKIANEYLNLPKSLACYEQVEGLVNGFLVDESGVSLLVGDEFYLFDDLEIKSIN